MGRPSNPRLMARVLDAVNQMCEGKGSTAREVLNFVRQNSNTASRHLTMQVQRALKHAVNAGLLKHRSGRYKVLIPLNPVHHCDDVVEAYKLAEGIPNLGEDSPTAVLDPTGRVVDQSRRRRRRRRRSSRHGRSRSSHRRRRRSGRRRRRPDEDMTGKRDHKDNPEITEEWRSPKMLSSSRNDVIANDDQLTMNPKSVKSKSLNSDRYLNNSGGSDCGSKHRSRRSKPSSHERRSSSRNEYYNNARHKSNRSSSRRRSQQEHQSRQPVAENEDAGMDCDETNGEMDHPGTPADQEMDNHHETDNYGSSGGY